MFVRSDAGEPGIVGCRFLDPEAIGEAAALA